MFQPDPPPGGEAYAPPARLAAAERGVALLARTDAARFGWDGAPRRAGLSGALRRLFVGLTGIEPVPALADPRLERLRLFACMMRRGDARAGPLAEALLHDGFAEAALREAVELALS